MKKISGQKHWIQLVLFFCFVCSSYLDGEEIDQSQKLTLTIESALSRALNYNRNLIGTSQNVVNTEFSIQLSKSVFDIKFSPNTRAGLTGGGDHGEGMAMGGGIDISKRFAEGTYVSFAPSVLKTKDHYFTDMRAKIVQPLLRGFGAEYQQSALRGAEFSNRSSRRALFTAQVQLAVKTITTLYDIVKAKKAVELNEESYKRIESYAQAAKLKERIGLSDALDVYRAEIELRQALDTLTSSQDRLQDVADSLRDILALPLDMQFEVEVPLVYTPSDMEIDKAIELALANRVEIDQGIDQWRESYRLAKIAKKDLMPEINLVLDYTNSGRHEFFTRSCHYGKRESKWGVGFATSTDFDPLGDQFAYDQSLIAISDAARDLEQTRSNLTIEVKKVVRQLERSYKRILLQEEQIHTSQGELHLSKLKFDRGMANNFDVIQAEKNFRSAEQTYWNALIDHIIAEYQLLQAIGLLTDKPCVE
jgi:outer membrane protein